MGNADGDDGRGAFLLLHRHGMQPGHDRDARPRLLGRIASISYENAECRGYDALRCLSCREREVLRAAIRQGCYTCPRRTSATALAEMLWYSKSMTVEFLRKAENKVNARMARDPGKH